MGVGENSFSIQLSTANILKTPETFNYVWTDPN